MNFWDLAISKLATLLVTLGVIFVGQSSSPAPVVSVSDIPSSVQVQPREVFPDSETAEEIVVTVPPESSKPTESEQPVTVPVIDPETPDVDESVLVDLQKKLADLTAELNKTLAEKSPEPNLFTVADINNKTRGALVNIYCVSKTPLVRSITGSGVIVDPRGIILTNAHVAQLFLLEDYPSIGSVNCSIRSGSPAVTKYKAKLVYLPEMWINDNKHVLTESNPEGTGENDFALLKITSSVSGPLPLEFPNLRMLINDDLKKDESVIVAGYAAGFLSGFSVQRELYPVSAATKIGKLYTFGGQTLDLISLGGSIVAQKGSSGGAAVDEDGNLIGVIVTSTDGAILEERDLRAITIGHIDRSIKDENGNNLSSLLSGDLDSKIGNFYSFLLPKLKKVLVDEIESSN